MSKIPGLRAAACLKSALTDAGLGRTSNLNGGAIVGWIAPNRFGSTGFSIREREDGRIDWHLVISGRPHFRYVQGRNEESYEPIRTETVHPKIAAVFRQFGLAAADIELGGYQTRWDDDVDFNVVTERPAWLADDNRVSAPDAPPILTCRQTLGYRDTLPCFSKTALVAYEFGRDEIFLTRESVAAFHADWVRYRDEDARLAQGLGGYASRAGEMTFDGERLVMRNVAGTTLTVEAIELENAWGDEVVVFSMPSKWFTDTIEFAPEVPFMLNGAMREDRCWREVEAQRGWDVPWLQPLPRAVPAPDR